MGLQEHMGVITKIAEVAGKEYSIEQVCVFVGSFVLVKLGYNLYYHCYHFLSATE